MPESMGLFGSHLFEQGCNFFWGELVDLQKRASNFINLVLITQFYAEYQGQFGNGWSKKELLQ